MPKPPILTARDIETLKTLNRCVVMTTAQIKETGFHEAKWYHYKRLKVLEKRGYIRRSGEYLELTRKGMDVITALGEPVEPVERLKPKTRQDRTKIAALSQIHLESRDIGWEFLPGSVAKRKYRLNRGDRVKGILRKNEEIAVYVLSDKPTARTIQRVRQEISLLWRVRLDSALVLCPTDGALKAFGGKALALKRLMVLPKYLTSQRFWDNIVCDKGNNSKKNLAMVDKSPFHFVASLAPSHLKKIMKVPLELYRDCRSEWLKDEKYYLTREKVFGTERIVVCVYNPALLEGQLQGIYNNLAKTEKLLNLLQEKLLAWKDADKRGKRPTAASVEKQVNRILTRQFMKNLIRYTVRDVDGKWVDFQYNVDEKSFEELKNSSLGKTILFTDREDWQAEDIILAYRDQYKIEQSFRQMKDPSWVSWDPLFHCTDQKIKVHAFYCFSALLMSVLLKKELQNRGIPMSLSRAFEKLCKIQEVTIEYPAPKRTQEPVRVVMLTEMDQEQKEFFEALDLGKYTV